jgi:hypothetical protein
MFTFVRVERPPVPKEAMPEQSRRFRLLHPRAARAERQAAEREHWAAVARDYREHQRALSAKVMADHNARVRENAERAAAKEAASEAARKANRVPVVEIGTARREGDRVVLDGFKFAGQGGEHELPEGPIPGWLGWTGAELEEMARQEAAYQAPSANRDAPERDAPEREAGE